MPMHLEIITAERQVYSDEVDMVIAPGFDGQLGILPMHAPLMTMLKPGELTVRKDGASNAQNKPFGGRKNAWPTAVRTWSLNGRCQPFAGPKCG